MRCIGADTNRGATWNYNRLVPLARGRYFKWAAHDDVCGAGFLRQCVDDVLDDQPSVSVAYPQTLLVGADDEVLDAAFVDGLAIGDADRVERFPAVRGPRGGAARGVRRHPAGRAPGPHDADRDSTRIRRTAQLRYHLRSAGTTYHGASSVLVRWIASSNASW